jgi:hypothetical protein
VHYVILRPPEDACIERVRERSGHGFTDLDAARRMYGEFGNAALASAGIGQRHVVDAGESVDAALLAGQICALVRGGLLTIFNCGGYSSTSN